MVPLRYLFPTTIVTFVHSLSSLPIRQVQGTPSNFRSSFSALPSAVDPLHHPSITPILNTSAANAMARALFAFVCWQDVINNMSSETLGMDLVALGLLA
jgi:hypothetical protein